MWGRSITLEQLKPLLSPKWEQFIPGLWQRPYWSGILQDINDSLSKGQIIRPDMSNVFRALNEVSFDQIRVVLVGQDPYPSDAAIGLSFAMRSQMKIQPSLMNIFKELDRCYDTSLTTTRVFNGDLSSWSRQGVFLLNASLTVGCAYGRNSQHTHWSEFTADVMRYIDETYTCVFMAFGSSALMTCLKLSQSKRDQKSTEYPTSYGNSIITCTHPSPMANARTTKPFVGSNIFVRCNELLREQHLFPVIWTNLE